MRMHLVALAAALCLATPVIAGELDREFKGGDVKARATAPPAPTEVASERVSGTELDDESPTQAWHRRGWGYGWGWGGGFRVGWGGGWGYGYRGWGGWGGYSSWYRPYHGFHGGLGYWPSYYRPFYSSYAFSYPSWGYASFGYPGWGHCYW